MEMEEIRIEQTAEIILTYRQPETVRPVVLRYERELPEAMRPAPPPAPAAESAPPPPQRAADPLRAAIAPPEKKKTHWGVRLYVGISLLMILICLGTGIWYFTQNGVVPPGRTAPDGDDAPPRDGNYHGYYYYWDEDPEPEDKTISIPVYPTGGETRLHLAGAAELPVLTPGEIYDRVVLSVVTVLGQQPRSSTVSVGSGVIFSSDGYIVTNCHVISGCSSCKVLVTDTYGIDVQYVAKVVGYDEDKDLAVLKVEVEGLPAAAFGVSDDLHVGDPSYAIGSPLGLDLRSTLTTGSISAVNRDLDVDGVTMTLLQTDAALNSGNSGGPLINQYGQVVGINTIKMMSQYDTIEGLGFAIPSSLAVRWINELIEFGVLQPQPVLGVSIDKIPSTLPDGALGLRVASVTKGLTGDRAGIRVGDYVVAFNGQTVTALQQILALRRELYVGDEVPIRVFRDGEYMDIMLIMMAES